MLLIPLAAAWPADQDWETLTMTTGSCGKADRQAYDMAGDVPSAPSWTDIVGSSCKDIGAAHWYLDDENLYLRMQLAETPLAGDDSLQEGAWGYLFVPQGETVTYDYLLALSDYGSSLAISANSQDQGEDWSDVAEDQLWLQTGALEKGLVRVQAGGMMGQSFLDLTVPRAELEAQKDLSSSTPFSLLVGTSSSNTLDQLDGDLAGVRNDVEVGSIAEEALAPICFDEDEDGLHHFAEEEQGTGGADADSDEDGLQDGAEVEAGTVPLLCDSDGDGLSDGLELGVEEADDDTVVEEGCFVADADPASTTDPLAADSDGDGLDDGVEDEDLDGMHEPWESDPNDPDDAEDTDGDGIIEGIEAHCEGDDSDDRDGDGIDDLSEGLDDPDHDGLPCFCDEDSDGDGINDEEEGAGDTDGDGRPDYRDQDADDDGVYDGEEGTEDLDCDDLPDFQDPWNEDGPCGDPDGDLRDNQTEAECGTNPVDADSDDDGILDGAEDCDKDLDDTGLEEEPRQAPFSGGHFGGGCAVGGVSAGFWWLGILALGRRRRERVAP